MILNRVLIKISGEAISHKGSAFDIDIVSGICDNIKKVIDSGTSVSIVIGGGNIIRGRDFCHSKISRETADSVGMLATTMNGIIFREVFRNFGIEAKIVSSLPLPFSVHSSDFENIRKFLNKTIIFVGGIGYPYFSTDTVSAIAASLSGCDAILKATNTDGVYDKDPHLFPDAKFLSNLTYEYALAHDINIMDKTAFSIMLSSRRIPTYIFSIEEPNCFVNAINKNIKLSIVS